MPGDIRDDLEKAVESIESTSTSAGEVVGEAREVPGDAGDLQAEKPAVSAGDEAQTAVEAPAAPPATPPVDATAAPAPTPAPAPVRAPVSWKPEARETFAQLPPAAQAEIIRRERDIEAALQSTADSRRLADEFQTTIKPYEHLIAAETDNPMNAVKSLLNTAAVLRVGTPQQKAEMAVRTIVQYGIDVSLLDEMLSAHLSGKQDQPRVDPNIQHLQQQIAPVIEFVNGLRSKQQEFHQTQEQKLQTEVEDFMQNPQNEFFQDVQTDMADILELAARRGQKMSLQDAYNRATMLHPTISQIVEKRKLTSSAAQHNAVADRAAAAGASLPSSQAPSQDGDTIEEADSLRSALEAALAKQTNRI